MAGSDRASGPPRARSSADAACPAAGPWPDRRPPTIRSTLCPRRPAPAAPKARTGRASPADPCGTRARLDGMASPSARAARPRVVLGARSLQSDPWIDHRVQDVGDQNADQSQGGGDEVQREDHRKITLGYRIVAELPEAGPGEDLLENDGAADHPR